MHISVITGTALLGQKAAGRSAGDGPVHLCPGSSRRGSGRRNQPLSAAAPAARQVSANTWPASNSASSKHGLEGYRRTNRKQLV